MAANPEVVHIVSSGTTNGSFRAIIGIFGELEQAHMYVENHISGDSKEGELWCKSLKDKRQIWVRGVDLVDIEEHVVLNNWKDHPDFAFLQKES